MISEEKLKIQKLINKRDPIILDIGCYDGKDSFELFLLFKQPTMFAFEADPRSIELFEKLQRKIFIWPDLPPITLVRKAVGNVDGIITYYLSDSKTRRHYEQDLQTSWSASSSIKPPQNHLKIFKDIEFYQTINVECVKLDTWAKKNEIESIDLIWADVNGAEEDLIKGGLDIFSRTRYFYTEYSNEGLYEGQITLEQMKHMLPWFEEIERFEEGPNFGCILMGRKDD